MRSAARRCPSVAIATPHHLASAAGLAALARGANALDAAVAANLALGVVTPYLCGPGGDLFAIVWDGARLHGYLGSGRSPAAATIGTVRERTGATTMPVVGPHSVTVPGAVLGWFELLDRFGSCSFGDLGRDACRLALDGFRFGELGGHAVTGYRALYDGLDEWQATFGAVTARTWLRQPGAARLLEVLAEDGPDAFYRGPVATSIVEALARRGGFMSASDLATHANEWAEPLRAPYRDVEVAELPPPTQGVTALETLRLLDGFDLGAMAPAERVHLTVEATKLALADRDAHVTDPAHMRVDAGALLDDVYLATRRADIDADRAGHPAPGCPQPGGTAYLCAADADGMLVSLIQSNFVGFGSGVFVPEWGLNLNDRGASFTLHPDRVNALAPGKRPLHTLIPAMVLRDGNPVIVFGSMGGDAQAQVHAQVLPAMIDDEADAQVAIDAPRWRVDPFTWSLRLESRFAPDLVAALVARGHEVSPTTAFDTGMGHAHAIVVEDPGYAVACDPRSEGAALGL